ncbi:hypothetical protein L228DRAFT_80760 [Xylona heveae TC161]|uniref:FCP1 homology domain-containing protein n=1 Tax=Xylona heveae (strain CBS 132557 / TC161) TaxID=1328760 RepID=A0A165J2W3_XYLHT|nr:hypothetical protein L228DRAFT_80760 [Xylona heveae TC161]KZF25655.1 hypothetical protein L228DRAFT_80760 [Xylona heveae TC161]
MNSLNILSARVIGSTPPQTPIGSPSTSRGDITKEDQDQAYFPPEASALEDDALSSGEVPEKVPAEDSPYGPLLDSSSPSAPSASAMDEKLPLLSEQQPGLLTRSKRSSFLRIPKWFATTVATTVKWILSTLAAPGIYLAGCFYDDAGNFSMSMPARRVYHTVLRTIRPKDTMQRLTPLDDDRPPAKNGRQRSSRSRQSPKSSRRSLSASSSSSAITSESELEHERERSRATASSSSSSPRNNRSKSSSSASSEEIAPARRSIRIKLYNEESLKQRKQKRAEQADSKKTSSTSTGVKYSPTPLTADSIKSPTSAASSLRVTKYPRAPAPPRPLIPRRQPSYSYSSPFSPQIPQKTLIIDLDETLIHSLAKGGRMSSGHMVEVKLNVPVVGATGTTVGPQHPILYYVHKRPYCDEFLRKVCRWYNLVVFTASVQEYADPVIDWLEQERKYFSGRYYRQHCTFRNGAYIKDLSSVEPDLSKVMILDNSPMSYVFHEDNAIPIEGWINDPTDNDLLHLIPLLEGLQYVTDVRALLALRMGEAVA